jgi:hypothetical protein
MRNKAVNVLSGWYGVRNWVMLSKQRHVLEQIHKAAAAGRTSSKAA